jgi:O-antigen/teichoic acid export membrane protein
MTALIILKLYRKIWNEPLILQKLAIVGGIRQLASQTAWYGLSSIVGRFINYLLNPILTTIYASAAFGDISILFALAAFLNIIFTYGMETSYFRFNQKEKESSVFNSSMTILLTSTLVFTALLMLPSKQLASYMELGDHPEYVIYVILIVALDTLAVLPFSRLRLEGRPAKFAIIKVSNIIINVSLVIFFLYFCKSHHEAGGNDWMAHLYSEQIGIGYVFLSQLTASAITLLLLLPELKGFRPEFNKKLLKEIFLYSSPLIIVGFGGMVNETIDRFMIIQFFNGTVDQARSANGIYSANYKLAALIVIFIQTFRMGAEPFFFKNSNAENAKENYVRIMNLFVIACCCCFLGVSLYLDVWKYFMGVRKHPEYLEGLFIVPLLMLAKIFLGIYYNLSIWYKLTDRNKTGAFITLAGAMITILLNFLLIPYLGYWACAIATTGCYATMMFTSYYLGNKYYPIPYQWKKNFGYIFLSVLLYLVHYGLRRMGANTVYLHASATLLFFVFVWIVLRLERKELANVPLLKKVYRFL